MVTELIVGWLGEFATVKLAECLLSGVSSNLKSSDLKEVLKSAAQTAQEEQSQLFYSCSPDFIPKFLGTFFECTVTELQKPLINQGIPDIDFLEKAFIKKLDKFPKFKDKINTINIKPWLETFINVFIKKSEIYQRFRVAKEDYLKQLSKYFDDVKFAGIAVEVQEIDISNQLAKIFVMPEVAEEKSNYSSRRL